MKVFLLKFLLKFGLPRILISLLPPDINIWIEILIYLSINYTFLILEPQKQEFNGVLVNEPLENPLELNIENPYAFFD